MMLVDTVGTLWVVHGALSFFTHIKQLDRKKIIFWEYVMIHRKYHTQIIPTCCCKIIHHIATRRPNYKCPGTASPRLIGYCGHVN